MAFVAGQTLTAAQLNDFSTDSLGVGTTSPETPITIVTTNKLGSSFTGTTDGEGLRVDQSNYTADNYVSLVEASYDDGQTAPHVRVGAQFTGSGSKLAFGTTNNYSSGITNQALTIDQTGKVGINTGSPNNPLHVVAASSAFIQQDNGTATTYLGPDSSNTGLFGTITAHDVRFVTNNSERMRISSSGAVTIGGSLSKGSGSFRIPHPLPAKTETHDLVHSFVEAPQADNIYRGQVALSGGAATVDLDVAAGMTDGTFELLNRDLQCFVVNNAGWTAVRGSVSGSTLTIEAQDASCTDTVDWLVIGERHDQHMLDTGWTDNNGRVIVEPALTEARPQAEGSADDDSGDDSKGD